MKRILPLFYALGALLLFAGLVRLTFFVAYELLNLSVEGHGALSTPKTLVNFIFDAALVLVVVLLYRWRKIPGLTSMGTRLGGGAGRITLYCLGILVLQYLVIIAVTTMLGTAWSLGDFSLPNLLRALVLMLGVGIGEEFYFRAGIFKMLQPYGRLTAYLLGTFIFAWAHFFGEPFNVLRLLGTFLPGLLFAYIYEQSRSIWPGAFVHAAMNLFSLLVIHQVAGVSVLVYTGNEGLVTGIWTLSYTLVLLIQAVVIRQVIRREVVNR